MCIKSKNSFMTWGVLDVYNRFYCWIDEFMNGPLSAFHAFVTIRFPSERVNRERIPLGGS